MLKGKPVLKVLGAQPWGSRRGMEASGGGEKLEHRMESLEGGVIHQTCRISSHLAHF